MRILYIDGVGPFGGASRSLYEVLRALPAGAVRKYFVLARGTVVPYYSQIAEDVIATQGLTRFDNTQYSYYRGLRWLVLLREFLHAPFTVAALVRARLRWGAVDVIHVNEITEIVPMLLARNIFRAPVVVHVRSVMRKDAQSLRCRWIDHVLRRKVAAVIAIDDSVRESLSPELSVNVIHNSFTPSYSGSPDETFARKLEPIRASSFKVGFVGNLLLVKGLFDLLDAARLVCEAGHDVEFLIVGDVARSDKGVKAWFLERLRLAQDIKSDLAARIEAAGLSDRFHLLGATHDIQRVYERFNVLCFPSHFDAPGRPIFEAAFSGVPAIAAINNPKPDTLVHMHTGMAVPPRSPQKLAEAIIFLAQNPEEASRMGRNARALAMQNFHPPANAERLLAVYRSVVAPRSIRPAAPVKNTEATG